MKNITRVVNWNAYDEGFGDAGFRIVVSIIDG